MSYDQALKWTLIGSVAILDLILLNFCKLELQWSDLIVPAACGGLLSALSIYYHHRDGDSLVLCMVSLLQIGSYTSVIAVLIYVGISFGFPLTDPWLRAVDEWVGFSPVAVVNWMRSHPSLEGFSTWVYLFIVPQSLVAVLAISLAGKRILLEQFVLQFMLGTLICAMFGWFLPAWGPIHGYGISPAPWQQPYLDHLAALQSADRFMFSWKETEGLVTFPSFHTAWAIFLILLWREQTRWLFIPMAVVNLLIVLSTLTTGSHYIIDLIGGVLLASACIAVSHRVTAWAYHPDGSPRVIFWSHWPLNELNRQLAR